MIPTFVPFLDSLTIGTYDDFHAGGFWRDIENGAYRPSEAREGMIRSPILLIAAPTDRHFSHLPSE